MTTLQNNEELEIIDLKSKLSKYFKKEDSLKRLELQQYLIYNRFYDIEYNKKINLHFVRSQNSIFDYVIELKKYIEFNFNDNILIDENILKKDVEDFSKYTDFNRTIK